MAAFFVRHESCVVRTPFNRANIDIRHEANVVDLRILLACKQIHPEAATLPFRHNRSLFPRVRDLTHFGSHWITASQRRAICSIHVETHLGDVWLSRDVVMDFPSLKHITISAGIAEPIRAEAGQRQDQDHMKEFLMSTKTALDFKRWDGVTLYPYLWRAHSDMGKDFTMAKKYQDMARKLSKELTESIS